MNRLPSETGALAGARGSTGSTWARGRVGAASLGLVLLGAVLGACEDEPAHQPMVEEQGERPDDAPRPPQDMAWVIFDGDTVSAEVAATPEQRERGLQFREHLPAGSGMIFVFDEVDTRAFHMGDTFIPLDIAYMDQNLRIVDIQQMEPESGDLYESTEPAMFALEVPQGWFEEQGIEVGDEAEVVFGPIS